MHYSYDKLKGRIIEKYHTLANFADALGVSRQFVYYRLGSKQGFSRETIEKWSDLLDIDLSEYGEYFFT